MKILIIGSNKEWAFENHYIKHLSKNKIEIESFPAHDIFYEYYYNTVFNKIKFRLGISSIYKKINQLLLDHLKTNHYDIIWVFKGMELFPNTLQQLKNSGIRLVNFNPDHPFVHNFRGSGNKNIINSIGIYDLHLCYSLPVKERIEREYKIKSYWLPFGYESDNVSIPSRENEKVRACFIGNPDKFRATTIQNLLSHNISVDLYGNQWVKWVPLKKNYNLNIFDPIYKADFNQIATQYRLQLNIFRPHNDNSHNMRTFEMPGLGCIMLAPESDEHTRLFNNNSEAFFYSNMDEMIVKSRQILEMDYETALTIRKNALKRSVDSGYSYEKRTEQVIKMFESILP